MENFDDIKVLWHSEKARQLPAVDEFVVIVNKYKRRRRHISNWSLGLLFICVFGFAAVWFGYKSTMWTTRLGQVLIFAAFFYVIYLTCRDLQKKKKEESMDSGFFLATLKKEVAEENEVKKRILIFLSMICVGYGFFIYEKASGSMQSLIIRYTILISVICFFWFIYRPLVNRLYQKSVKKMLAKIEEIQNQIS
jgi:hypothetical protein